MFDYLFLSRPAVWRFFTLPTASLRGRLRYPLVMITGVSKASRRGSSTCFSLNTESQRMNIIE